MAAWSQTFTFLEGEWLEGNRRSSAPRTHAFWLGSSVFDGARAFDGVAPDLDRHCARLNRSAVAMWLEPADVRRGDRASSPATGVGKFAPGAELYIRPMYWAEEGGASRPSARPGLDALLPLHLRGAAAGADTAARSPARPSPSRSR